MKLGRIASVACTTAVIGSGVFAAAVPAADAATISQAYSCSSPVGTLSASVKVAGAAALNSTGSAIILSKVKFTITNPTTTTISADHIVVTVPDPNPTSAPYKAGTAKVASTPAGWTAGHNTSGVFAEHTGTITLAGGGTVSNAALSARYANKGPHGTVISYKPGPVSFDLTSPISGPVSCTPNPPVGTFASVTE
jgi:hypothetical protein